MKARSVSTRPDKPTKRRKYRDRGDLVKVAARISGRSTKTVYAVLNGACTSAPVKAAIEQARVELRANARTAA